MSSNFHKKPYTKESLLKLNIFQEYIREWIPVMLCTSASFAQNINIWDLFAGPGQDIEGTKGTPLIIIEELNNYLKLIREKRKNVNVVLNDNHKDKYGCLLKLINSLDLQIGVKIELYNDDFNSLFEKLENRLKNSASLIILDQCGVKSINEEIFHKLINYPTTDFIFFLSSSLIRRFSDNINFLQDSNVDTSGIKNVDYFSVHREALKCYKDLIPNGREYYIHAFSIKNGSNIYGIIFGSNNILAMLKFLKVCWKNDAVNGEANYDIDHDHINPDRPMLFEEMNKPNKINKYEAKLKKIIEENNDLTNHLLIKFSVAEGIELSQTKNILKSFKEAKLISKIPNISYEAYLKNPQPIDKI